MAQDQLVNIDGEAKRGIVAELLEQEREEKTGRPQFKHTTLPRNPSHGP